MICYDPLETMLAAMRLCGFAVSSNQPRRRLACAGRNEAGSAPMGGSRRLQQCRDDDRDPLRVPALDRLMV
jgi:hypothetical protein